jgi:hypothetical protein
LTFVHLEGDPSQQQMPPPCCGVGSGSVLAGVSGGGCSAAVGSAVAPLAAAVGFSSSDESRRDLRLEATSQPVSGTTMSTDAMPAIKRLRVVLFGRSRGGGGGGKGANDWCA